MQGRSEFVLTFAQAQVSARLDQPQAVKGLVIFAHGSGSSRMSPRNLSVAQALNEAGLSTLLFDLLTPEESRDRSLSFDIDFLGERLEQVVDWVGTRPELREWPIGIFGASTGGAAALVVAAERPERVRAVVSRGGRPDLAMHVIDNVLAPSLFIVGGHDYEVIHFNRKAFSRLKGAKDLAIITKATHLFEEPGALEEVADLARDWFVRFLPRYLPVHEPRQTDQPFS